MIVRWIAIEMNLNGTFKIVHRMKGSTFVLDNTHKNGIRRLFLPLCKVKVVTAGTAFEIEQIFKIGNTSIYLYIDVQSQIAWHYVKCG